MGKWLGVKATIYHKAKVIHFVPKADNDLELPDNGVPLLAMCGKRAKYGWSKPSNCNLPKCDRCVQKLGNGDR